MIINDNNNDKYNEHIANNAAPVAAATVTTRRPTRPASSGRPCAV